MVKILYSFGKDKIGSFIASLLSKDAKKRQKNILSLYWLTQLTQETPNLAILQAIHQEYGRQHCPHHTPYDLSISAKASVLIKALGDKEQRVRHIAHSALVIMGELAIPALALALESKDSSRRLAVVKVLADIRTTKTFFALRESIQDKDSKVRKAVTEALKKIK